MRRFLILPLAFAAVLAGGAVRIVQDQCGPFTDVTPGFCPYVLELYYLGITVGTSATTFSPDDPLTRGQAAVFVAKGLNQSLARSSRRAALGQWWTPNEVVLSLFAIPLGNYGAQPVSDGEDIWVPLFNLPAVARFHASDGRLIEYRDGTANGYGTLVAMGRVFITGFTFPGKLYMIDPSAAGPATTVADNLGGDLGGDPSGIAFDGAKLWTVNGSGGVSIITPSSSFPWSVINVTKGFTGSAGILFDGSNIWVTDASGLLKLDANGAVLQTVPAFGYFPAFDGKNIWVPSPAGTLTVVDSATGSILATVAGNGLDSPFSAAFDGERILVVGNNLSLWRAADLAPLGFVPFSQAQSQISWSCSDGLNFWIDSSAGHNLVRF